MQQIDRLRKLQNRMRKPTTANKTTFSNQQAPVNVNNHEDSQKSVKSMNDSNKISVIQKKIKVESNMHSQNDNALSNREPQSLVKDSHVRQDNPEYVHMTEEQMNRNRKITDYFFLQRKQCPGKKKAAKLNGHQIDIHQIQKSQKHIEAKMEVANQIRDKQVKQESNNFQGLSQNNYSNALTNQNGQTNLPCSEKLKQQNKMLKDKLKSKDDYLNNFKSQMKKDMLQLVIKIHKMKRNQIRMRVSQNKIRLGEYLSYKKGQDVWIDGTEIRQVKQKLQNIAKQKQQLEKTKKNQSRKPNQQQEQKKNAISCQMHFLSRQESHYQQIIKRLQQQKSLHIKQYKLLFQQEHSRYGKIDPQTGLSNWPNIKQYQLLGLLGKGGFSEVYKAFDSQDLKQVACKVHQFNTAWNDSAKQNYIKHAIRQNKVHKVLNHPNIVRLFDTVQIDTTSFCTILEYCQGPDLSYYLKKHKKLPEKQAKMIIRQVILAIKYLHQLNDKVIHYDLKPQNILFHKGRIKITDFGLCKTTKQEVIELTSQGVGTYWYLPPQCFVTDQKALITTKVDIWAIGVIFFEMLYGEKPFGDKMSQMRILNQGIMLKATQVVFPQTPKGTVSNQSKDFIKACLTWKTEDRVDIQGLYEHPVFEKK